MKKFFFFIFILVIIYTFVYNISNALASNEKEKLKLKKSNDTNVSIVVFSISNEMLYINQQHFANVKKLQHILLMCLTSENKKHILDNLGIESIKLSLYENFKKEIYKNLKIFFQFIKNNFDYLNEVINKEKKKDKLSQTYYIENDKLLNLLEKVMNFDKENNSIYIEKLHQFKNVMECVNVSISMNLENEKNPIVLIMKIDENNNNISIKIDNNLSSENINSIRKNEYLNTDKIQILQNILYPLKTGNLILRSSKSLKWPLKYFRNLCSSNNYKVASENWVNYFYDHNETLCHVETCGSGDCLFLTLEYLLSENGIRTYNIFTNENIKESKFIKWYVENIKSPNQKKFNVVDLRYITTYYVIKYFPGYSNEYDIDESYINDKLDLLINLEFTNYYLKKESIYEMIQHKYEGDKLKGNVFLSTISDFFSNVLPFHNISPSYNVNNNNYNDDDYNDDSNYNDDNNYNSDDNTDNNNQNDDDFNNNSNNNNNGDDSNDRNSNNDNVSNDKNSNSGNVSNDKNSNNGNVSNDKNSNNNDISNDKNSNNNDISNNKNGNRDDDYNNTYYNRECTDSCNNNSFLSYDNNKYYSTFLPEHKKILSYDIQDEIISSNEKDTILLSKNRNIIDYNENKDTKSINNAERKNYEDEYEDILHDIDDFGNRMYELIFFKIVSLSDNDLTLDKLKKINKKSLTKLKGTNLKVKVIGSHVFMKNIEEGIILPFYNLDNIKNKLNNPFSKKNYANKDLHVVVIKTTFNKNIKNSNGVTTRSLLLRHDGDCISYWSIKNNKYHFTSDNKVIQTSTFQEKASAFFYERTRTGQTHWGDEIDYDAFQKMFNIGLITFINNSTEFFFSKDTFKEYELYLLIYFYSDIHFEPGIHIIVKGKNTSLNSAYKKNKIPLSFLEIIKK
ncbi:conserved Plasmodium protein, unknown function [Plasmodium relictum]|uniref:OTU domain-containing protein n=1 Tax=Plasmodium relictum TaxID=85471 RepID=A0A1J1H9D4_PLARL|nr:conserved Plasmodium protein, unknown function [Plasmodium relictum]CRH01586.1 conserved Plasmodium protein, unknown function [Plasmodium relictum]